MAKERFAAFEAGGAERVGLRIHGFILDRRDGSVALWGASGYSSHDTVMEDIQRMTRSLNHLRTRKRQLMWNDRTIQQMMHDDVRWRVFKDQIDALDPWVVEPKTLSGREER